MHFLDLYHYFHNILQADVTNPMTGCTTICGREPYSAPEVQFLGPKGYGLAADWWSVGVLIYKMLIGKVNHQSEYFKLFLKIVLMIIILTFNLPQRKNCITIIELK